MDRKNLISKEVLQAFIKEAMRQKIKEMVKKVQEELRPYLENPKKN